MLAFKRLLGYFGQIACLKRKKPTHVCAVSDIRNYDLNGIKQHAINTAWTLCVFVEWKSFCKYSSHFVHLYYQFRK